MNPLTNYINRYSDLRKQYAIEPDLETIQKAISTNPSGLNNYVMAGLGMGTLILRMGAVIQMCRKFEELDDQGDILFMKQIVDNLSESLPSDTNWKNLWVISAEDNALWMQPALQPKGGQSLLERFITFRNRFVHQQIRIEHEYDKEIVKAVQILDDFAQLSGLFEEGDLIIKEGKCFWLTAEGTIPLYPYMQPGKTDNEPYIFQGLYKSKSEAHFLNTKYGNEEEQKAEEHIDPVFQPIRKLVSTGAGQIFDHSSRLSYYRECFVGRDRETNAVLTWCKDATDRNILPIKSPAGMGKGALVAEIIQQLEQERVQVLYHFCGAGNQNSLHAVLYHLILQGKRKNYWDNQDEHVARKLNRLPSKYIDLVHFFQLLLDQSLKLNRANETGNLVIVIDGLDEAQVAYSQLKIADWFYTYNEKEEPEADWRSASNIRWVFTYRCAEDGTENFYRFPSFKEVFQLEEVQPLKGLDESAVEAALEQFAPSREFLKEVKLKSLVSH